MWLSGRTRDKAGRGGAVPTVEGPLDRQTSLTGRCTSELPHGNHRVELGRPGPMRGRTADHASFIGEVLLALKLRGSASHASARDA